MLWTTQSNIREKGWVMIGVDKFLVAYLAGVVVVALMGSSGTGAGCHELGSARKI